MTDVRGRIVLALLVLGVVAASRAAQADVAEARRLFVEAEHSYARGDWRAAFASYQAAYRAEPLPDFLFNMGQCQRRLGDRVRALGYYRRFLATSPPEDKRRIAATFVRDLERDSPRPPAVEPQRHRPSPPEAAPARERPGILARLRAPTWVIGAVGVAGLATGGVFAWLAAGEQHELDTAPCEREIDRCLAIRDRAATWFAAQNVALAAGGALLVAAIVLAVVDASATPEPGTSSRSTLAPFVKTGGTGFTGGLRW